MSEVSAIITSYQRDIKIVARAIDSILNQTFSDIEILVVDDNHPKSAFSADLKMLCEEKKVIYLTQGANKGACSARNYGIKHSNGKYIGFLDDDDEWLPEKIAKQIAAFEKNPEAGIIYCRGNIVNVDRHEIIAVYNDNKIRKDLSCEDLLGLDYVGSTSQPLIKKECFQAVGGFWEEQPARQDYEMWIRISQKFRIYGINDILFNHNMHEGEQISKNYEKSYRGYKNILKRYAKQYDKYPKAKRNMMKILCGVCLKKRSAECFIYGFSFFWLCAKVFVKETFFHNNSRTK